MADAVLGSQLLAVARTAGQAQRLSVPTGCSTIDRSLIGGFRYGEVSSLAGLDGTGKAVIALHAMASHLLFDEASEVAVIDTTGSFSPPVLRDIILARHQDTRGVEADQHANLSVDDVVKCLSRVQIMRVFDLAGATESLQEISEVWSRSARKSMVIGRRSVAAAAEIKSSQDDEDELVDDAPSTDMEESGLEQRATFGGKMILIDMMSNIVNRELSGDWIEGQAKFSIFRRDLSQVTTECAACTLIINQAVRPSPDFGTHPADEEGTGRADTHSLGVVPGLGRAYLQAVDFSVLLVQTRNTREASFMLEVLSDRFGGRTGLKAAYALQNHMLAPAP